MKDGKASRMEARKEDVETNGKSILNLLNCLLKQQRSSKECKTVKVVLVLSGHD